MLLGSVVGGYRILDIVGEGGMGTVFRAVDIQLERDVAIKLLRPELTHQPDLVMRFKTEAVALARLNHPHIVTLHHMFSDRDQYYMVLEFVQGETIDKLIKRCGKIPWRTAVPLICQSLNGLEHAHILKVIHRDIKPSNLILTTHNTVKIMDFGIARMLETDGLTQAGNILGTVKYMSPEQILGQEIDFRVDIYGIGAVLYEMILGQPPFEKKTHYDLVRTKIEELPDSLCKLEIDIPPRLDTAILKALSGSPDDRFQSAGQFRDELEAILAEPGYDGESEETILDLRRRVAPEPPTNSGSETKAGSAARVNTLEKSPSELHSPELNVATIDAFDRTGTHSGSNRSAKKPILIAAGLCSLAATAFLLKELSGPGDKRDNPIVVDSTPSTTAEPAAVAPPVISIPELAPSTDEKKSQINPEESTTPATTTLPNLPPLSTNPDHSESDIPSSIPPFSEGAAANPSSLPPVEKGETEEPHQSMNEPPNTSLPSGEPVQVEPETEKADGIRPGSVVNAPQKPALQSKTKIKRKSRLLHKHHWNSRHKFDPWIIKTE